MTHEEKIIGTLILLIPSLIIAWLNISVIRKRSPEDEHRVSTIPFFGGFFAVVALFSFWTSPFALFGIIFDVHLWEVLSYEIKSRKSSRQTPES